MLSIYDTYNGEDFFMVHYAYSDITSIDCEYAPLELNEARKLYADYVSDPRYTHVYVTKENKFEGTSIQVSSAALLEGTE